MSEASLIGKLKKFWVLLGLTLGCQTTIGAVRPLQCTFSYGGESKTMRIDPTGDPYQVKPVEVGSRMAWKVIYVTQPKEESVFSVYVYLLADEGPKLIQQAKYKPPFPVANQTGEFTGIQTIYEPTIGSDLQYTCGWEP
jgi:hypothetical protein